MKRLFSSTPQFLNSSIPQFLKHSNTMNIIYSASGVLCLFYMGLLMSKQQKELKDYLLAGWFVLILLGISVAYLNYNQVEGWRALFELTDASVFLHGPIIWFYTLALTEKSFHLRMKDSWHLLPFFVGGTVLMYPVLFGNSISDEGRNTILVIKMLVLIAYAIATLFRLRLHEAQIGDYYSFTEKIDLNWLKFLVWAVIIIWFISVVSQSLFYFGLDIPQYGGLYTNLAISLFVLVMGYFGIRQMNVFTSPFEQSVIDISVKTEPIEVVESVAKAPSKQEIRFSRLEQYMLEHKPYLESELTLYKLAGMIEVPPYQLSQLINQYGGKNFFHFVNQYRVKEVQSRIQARAHIKQTLLAIGLDCGF